jgi:hypothetical protein
MVCCIKSLISKGTIKIKNRRRETMKAKIINTTLVIILILLASANIYSQDKSTNHVFEMTFISIGYDQISDFMDMYEKELKPMDMQNEYVLSTKIFRHLNGPSWNVCLVSEYKDMDAWVAADKKFDDIVAASYPDKSKREEMFKKWGSFLRGLP